MLLYIRRDNMRFFKNIFGSKVSSERPVNQHERICGVCGGELLIRKNVMYMVLEARYYCSACKLHVHNAKAVGRDIHFDEKGGASESCCGNCRWSTLSSRYSIDKSTNPMWCTKYENKVDRSDLCRVHWIIRSGT